jgi:hypothetical protein
MVPRFLRQPEKTVKNIAQVLIYVSVRHPDYAPAPRSQIGVATVIMFLLFVGTVCGAIHFDDDPRKRTREIRHIRSDRMLAAEMHSINRATANSGP